MSTQHYFIVFAGLNISCIMLKNGQTFFIVLRCSQMFGLFSTLRIKCLTGSKLCKTLQKFLRKKVFFKLYVFFWGGDSFDRLVYVESVVGRYKIMHDG